MTNGLGMALGLAMVGIIVLAAGSEQTKTMSDGRAGVRVSSDAWARRGVANGKPISARALAYIIVGHVEHHLHVLAERYGVQ
ncbi:MAG: hypothetical protein ACRDG7_02665 [Candidatus Limnocylindria bacterium]